MKKLHTFLIYVLLQRGITFIQYSQIQTASMKIYCNSKDVSTLVSAVVLIRVWFSGKFSSLLPHLLFAPLPNNTTDVEDALQKCTPALHSVS